MPDELVSHYRIIRLIREGGMGAVFQAEDLNLPRQVAIKRLRIAHRDPIGASERFLREALAVSRIDHPNVVTLYEAFQQDGVHYMVMQLVDGQSLRDRIRDGPLDPEEALRLACEIAAGLRAAHDIGIVHRDLKPDNVMLTRSGACKLLDFGVAHLADRPTTTERSLLLGTLPYMAVEQLRGTASDARTDVYALGILLFEMLTGRLPFEGRSDAELFYQIMNARPPELRSLRADLPPEIERIVRRALEKDARDRYSSMAQMLSDLETARRWMLAGRPTPRRRLLADTPSRVRIAPRVVVFTALVALAVAAVTVSFYRFALPGVPKVLVMRWENETGIAANEWLCGAIMDCLIRSLSVEPGIAVVSRQTVYSTLSAGRPTLGGFAPSMSMGVAGHLGAHYMVSGTIEPLAGNLRVNCDLIEVRSGRLLHSWRRELGDPQKEFYAMVDAFASAIAGRLPVKRASRKGAVPLARQMTASIEALRLYNEAIERKELRDAATACAKLREAVGLDSSFAEAHLLLAEYTPNPSERRRHLERAWTSRGSASRTTVLRIQAEQLLDAGDPDGAMKKYREVLAENVLDVEAHYGLADLYNRKKQHGMAAAEYAAMHQLNPFDFTFYPSWSWQYVEIGRKDKALNLLREWRRQFPEEQAPLASLIFHHLQFGGYVEGVRYCDTLASLRPGADRLGRALLLIELGRLHDADSILTVLESSPDPLLLPARASSYRAFLAYRRARYSEGQQLLARARGVHPDAYNEWLAGILTLGGGDPSGAEASARLLEERIASAPGDTGSLAGQTVRRLSFDLRGRIHLAVGRHQDAARQFESALRYTTRRDEAFIRTDLGRARMEGRDLPGAEREFERVLAINPQYGAALLGLSRARLGRADRRGAQALLSTLGEIWNHSDPDDPWRKEMERLQKESSSPGR